MNQAVTHRGALPPGTQVLDFEFQEVLGHGGFGITYRGWNTTLRKAVAIKEYMPAGTAVRETDQTVLPRSGDDENDYNWGLERFLDEARMLARFDHPGIVRVQQFFQAYGTAYIAMEFLEGETLAAIYRAESFVGEDRLRVWLAPVLDALEQVHAAAFLHRDIKPENVMFRRDGTPVLIDFGSARAAIAMRSQNMTAIVTPGFSPIEQYSASNEAMQGPWTDIYAIGGVLYRGMTGTVPNDATDRTMEDRLEPTGRAARGRYSRSLSDAVDWALRMRTADRPQSIEEWRTILDKGRRASRPSARVVAPPAALPPVAKPPVGKRVSRPATWLVAAGLSAVIAVGAAAYWWDTIVDPHPNGNKDEMRPEPAQSLAQKAAAIRSLIREGRLGTARERLVAARTLGLDDGTHRDLLAAIERAEAAPAANARAEEVRRLWGECEKHGSGGQLRAALACVRKVAALDPKHPEAADKVRRLKVMIAFEDASEKDTVEAYFGFEQAHRGTGEATVARFLLNKYEDGYWQEVRKSGTRAGYERYLVIYPTGRYADRARAELARGK